MGIQAFECKSTWPLLARKGRARSSERVSGIFVRSRSSKDAFWLILMRGGMRIVAARNAFHCFHVFRENTFGFQFSAINDFVLARKLYHRFISEHFTPFSTMPMTSRLVVCCAWHCCVGHPISIHRGTPQASAFENWNMSFVLWSVCQQW